MNNGMQNKKMDSMKHLNWHKKLPHIFLIRSIILCFLSSAIQFIDHDSHKMTAPPCGVDN